MARKHLVLGAVALALGIACIALVISSEEYDEDDTFVLGPAVPRAPPRQVKADLRRLEQDIVDGDSKLGPGPGELTLDAALAGNRGKRVKRGKNNRNGRGGNANRIKKNGRKNRRNAGRSRNFHPGWTILGGKGSKNGKTSNKNGKTSNKKSNKQSNKASGKGSSKGYSSNNGPPPASASPPNALSASLNAAESKQAKKLGKDVAQLNQDVKAAAAPPTGGKGGKK